MVYHKCWVKPTKPYPQQIVTTSDNREEEEEKGQKVVKSATDDAESGCVWIKVTEQEISNELLVLVK